MIGEAELRRQAASWGVDPMVADLDYSLGWFIAAFYSANSSAEQLYFKGGTCLRKCYFGDYRFSEDLDFTAAARFDPERLQRWVARAARWSAEHDGPDFEAGAPFIETLQEVVVRLGARCSTQCRKRKTCSCPILLQCCAG